jgi:hypothetical protein
MAGTKILLTIFVHDDQGEMDRQHKVTIDGTLTGPDALAELVAMHLHRLGAAEAASVTFCADGAFLDLGPDTNHRLEGRTQERDCPSSARQLPCRPPHLIGLGFAWIE